MKPVTLFTYALIVLYAWPAASQDDAGAALVEWRRKVTEAKALQDEVQKRDAMLALVREALPSHEVRLSGTNNQPAPIVNFDERLEKTGTYFLAQGTPYVVLGPRALDPRSPVFTRMIAEHELFHARRHVGDPRPLADRELETWTHVFVTYFHEVHPFKQRWAPLVSNYEEADPGERKAALDKLVNYYRTPPAAAGDEAGKADVRVAFEQWLGRRRKDPGTGLSKLVADLDRAITASSAGRSGRQLPASRRVVGPEHARSGEANESSRFQTSAA